MRGGLGFRKLKYLDRDNYEGCEAALWIPSFCFCSNKQHRGPFIFLCFYQETGGAALMKEIPVYAKSEHPGWLGFFLPMTQAYKNNDLKGQKSQGTCDPKVPFELFPLKICNSRSV